MRCVESSYYRPPFKEEQDDNVWYKNISYFDGSKHSDGLPDEVDWRTKNAVSAVKDQVSNKKWGLRLHIIDWPPILLS